MISCSKERTRCALLCHNKSATKLAAKKSIQEYITTFSRGKGFGVLPGKHGIDACAARRKIGF